MAGFPDYTHYDGVGLAELVRAKEVAPGELVEEAVGRIEALNPQLNAVIHAMYDTARRAAASRDLPDGPFHGVPFLLKDLLADVAGVPSTSGSRFHVGYLPDCDSEIVRRYKAAGVVILGKTNVPEYGLLPVTEPELFGPTRNPWDLARTPGGSSGGSAAAVAARMVPMAHGNGGGSIRVPASCCGLFGLKPTRGRNPLGPMLGEPWQGFVCDHVLTRTVRDSAAMLDATAGPDIGAPYYAPPPSRPFLEEVGRDPGKLRIAFSASPLTSGAVAPDCLKGLEAAIGLCLELGHEVEEAVLPFDGEAFARAFLTMVCVETRATIQEVEAHAGRQATPRDYEPVTWAAALLGRETGAVEFARAVHLLKRTGREVGHFFQSYDMFVTPTLACPPVAIGALLPQGAEAIALDILNRFNAGSLLSALHSADSMTQRILEFMPYTLLPNATGQPAMSVPLHWTEAGLPVGIQFIGRYADEATLFRLAAQMEAARPWAGRMPPICS